jgi:ankyrin repeat protein
MAGAIAVAALGLLLLFALTSFAQHRLVAAAQQGAVRTVEFWLAIGVDANARDHAGETALLHAAGAGHTPVVERLLAHGAIVDTANENGITPLMWASWNGEGPTVKLLLRYHADVNKRSHDGETALHKAAFRGQTVIVRDLLDAGGVVDESDHDGETALILAAAQGHQPIVRLLLDRGANPKAATRAGWTPLMAAAKGGHQSVVELLIPVSRVSAVGGDGDTALGLALISGNLGAVDLLLSAGAEESGVLWFWRGIRLARSGRYDEALPWLEKAVTDPVSITRPWRYTIDEVRYVVPLPASFAWLVLGTCRNQLGQTVKAGEAYRKGLAALPSSSESMVLFRRIAQRPGQSLVEQFNVRHDEIQKHVENPAGGWHMRVNYEKEEQDGHSQTRQTGHTDREVRTFFD